MIILEEKEGESAKNRILVIPGTNMSMEKAELEFMEDLIKEYDLLMLQLEIPMEVNEYGRTGLEKRNTGYAQSGSECAVVRSAAVVCYLSFAQ